MTTFPPTPDASPKVKNSLLSNSAPSPASSTSSVTLADEPSAYVSAEDDNSSSSPLAASASSPAHGNSSPTTPQSIAKSPKCTESETVPCMPPPPPSSLSSPALIGDFQRLSPSTHHNTAIGFDSLPPTVLVEIFGHALRGDCGEISPNFIEYTDPRFLNHNFCALLERRRSLSRLSRLNRFARAYLQPPLYSPAVVTSMAQLNSLSGYYYPEVDWKKKGRQPVLETDGNGTLVKPRLPAKRRKAFRGPARKIKELVVIIAGLPGGMLEDNPSVRWPGWYIEDWMRYDLEALAVERLTILAPSQVTAATILCATIPNYQTIKHLHIEVNIGEPAFAPETRFYNLAVHDSTRDHLCPRLVLHHDTLESLTLRNIHVCRHLFDQTNTWRRLRHLNVTFHNGLRGLCCADTTTNEPATPELEVSETNRRVWDFCQQRQYLTIELFAWYDFWSVMPGESVCSWRTVSVLLYRRVTPGGQLAFSPYEWWKALSDGTGCYATPGPSPAGTRIVNDSAEEEVEDEEEEVEECSEDQEEEEGSILLLDTQFSDVDGCLGGGGGGGVAVSQEEDIAILCAATRPRQMRIL